MESYTFKYNRRRTRTLLFFAIAWIILFCVSFFMKEHLNWYDFGCLAIGVTYLALWFRHISRQYAVLQQDQLTLYDDLFRKKVVDLNTVEQARYFAGDYILKIDQKQEVRLNTQLLDAPSVQRLEELLTSYDFKVIR